MEYFCINSKINQQTGHEVKSRCNLLVHCIQKRSLATEHHGSGGFDRIHGDWPRSCFQSHFVEGCKYLENVGVPKLAHLFSLARLVLYFENGTGSTCRYLKMAMSTPFSRQYSIEEWSQAREGSDSTVSSTKVRKSKSVYRSTEHTPGSPCEVMRTETGRIR